MKIVFILLRLVQKRGTPIMAMTLTRHLPGPLPQVVAANSGTKRTIFDTIGRCHQFNIYR